MPDCRKPRPPWTGICAPAGHVSIPELNQVFTGTRDKHALNLTNSALTYRADNQAAEADATLTPTRSTLDGIDTRPDQPHQTNSEKAWDVAVASGEVQVTGNVGRVQARM